MNHVGLGVATIGQTELERTPQETPALATELDRLDIQQWYRRVYARCLSILLSATDAEDATQETFMRAIVNLPELRTQLALSCWLRNIARNVCVDFIRRQQLRRADTMSLHEVAASPCGRHLVNEEHEHLMHHIYSLPEPLREIILLHYYEEMTYDQMAQWLGVARSTVNERLAKARLLLKQGLCSEKSR